MSKRPSKVVIGIGAISIALIGALLLFKGDGTGPKLVGYALLAAGFIGFSANIRG